MTIADPASYHPGGAMVQGGAGGRPRRWRAGSIALLILASWASSAQAQAPCPSPRPPFQFLRYAEDYGFLRDPACRTDFWDPIKFIPLDRTGEFYLTLGGDARIRYVYERYLLWGAGPDDDDGAILQRYHLHANLRLGSHVRLYGELKSNHESGREPVPFITDVNKLDLHQAFIDLGLNLGDDSPLTLRVGRQELRYGSGRLIFPRNGPNDRGTFDAVRLITRPGDWRVDLFAFRPVEIDEGIFDDNAIESASLWAGYAVGPMPGLPGAAVEPYYIGLDRDGSRFVQGSGHEVRHTVGARLSGRAGAWDYDVETTYQGGTFGRGSIQAWAVATHTGYTFRAAPLRPRIGLRVNAGSGDRDANDPDLQTFNALFPRGGLVGEGFGVLSPANLIHIRPSLDLRVTNRIYGFVGVDFLWRTSRGDGIYGPGGNVVRRPGTSQARYVGTDVDFSFNWEINRYLLLEVSGGYFFAGPFIEESGPGRNMYYVGPTLHYRF